MILLSARREEAQAQAATVLAAGYRECLQRQLSKAIGYLVEAKLQSLNRSIAALI
jgi:hypothetical protein